MDCFELDTLNQSLLLNWETCVDEVRCLRPITEICSFAKLLKEKKSKNFTSKCISFLSMCFDDMMCFGLWKL